MKRRYPSGSQKRKQKIKRVAEDTKSLSALSSWLKEKDSPTPSTSRNSAEKEHESSSDSDSLSRPTSPKSLELKDSTAMTITEVTSPEKQSSVFSNVITEVCNTASIPVFPGMVTNSEDKRKIIHSGAVQPNGPFPKNKDGRSFSTTYYTSTTKSGLKLKRFWLNYSTELDCVFCTPCWLFPQASIIGYH